MKQQKNKRAFALVVTLMVSLVIAMMLGATLALSPGRLARAGNTGDQALAESAIEAGIDYARARLQENPTWKGNLDKVVVDEPNLYIEEKDGMVVGLIRPSENEPYSMFRIRFNYYNGAPIVGELLDDGFDDPPTEFDFDMEDISINNLEGSRRWVPETDSSFNIVSFLSGRFEIPPGTVALGVEGFGGAGLNRIDKTNFKPPAGSRTYSRRSAMVVLAVAFADGAPDAAMMGGTDLDFTLPNGSGKIEVKAKGEEPRARTKGGIQMNVGGGGDPNLKTSGEIRYKTSVSSNLNPSVLPEDDGGAPFYQLDWNDIHKAENDGTKSIQIPGGTYVFHETSGELYYFDMTWEQYKILAATDPDPSTSGGTLLDHNMAGGFRQDSLNSNMVEIDPSNSELTFKGDVFITPTSNTAEFNLVPQRGAQKSAADTSDITDVAASKTQEDVKLILKPQGNAKAAITTTDATGNGNVLIAARVDSDKGGSIVAQGDVRLDAAKLDKLGKVGVSLFSQKDISISTFAPGASKYEDMGVEGLFYSWGDFDILTGEVGVLESKWGKIDLKGSVVAYGTSLSDPPSDSNDPGSTASGTIRVITKDATFEWDDKKLGDLLDISKFGDKTVLKRASYIRF